MSHEDAAAFAESAFENQDISSVWHGARLYAAGNISKNSVLGSNDNIFRDANNRFEEQHDDYLRLRKLGLVPQIRDLSLDEIVAERQRIHHNAPKALRFGRSG